MKFLVVLAIAVACVNGTPVSPAAAASLLGGGGGGGGGEADAPIVRSSFDSSPEGNSYNWGFETGNRITAQAEGVVKNPNSDNPALEVKGAYAYVSPDGTPVEITYLANENGFQPQGSHIPVAPPIPEAILRGLKIIESHTVPAAATALLGRK